MKISSGIKFLFAILFCFFSLQSIAQTEKADITKALNNYFTNLEQGNYQQVIDLTYPRLFELMPKQSMLEMMEGINKDPNYQVSISGNKINSISGIVVIDKTRYAKVDYAFKMTMLDKSPEKGTEEKGTIDVQKATLALFKQQYGESNVAYDPTERKYEIVANKQLLAVQDKQTKKWTFIGIEKRLNPMLEKILPKELLSE